MWRTWITVVTLALSASSWPARADTAKLRVEGGTLLLDCPKGWQAVRSGPAKEPTIRLLAGDKLAFRVIVTAVVAKALPTDAQLKALVREDRKSMLERIPSQTTTEPTPITGASATGYVYHLTDERSDDVGGDYREMDRGFLVVGPLILKLSILTHSGHGAVAKTALDVISNARFEPTSK